MKDAINSKIISIMRNHTLKSLDLTLGDKLLYCKWIFKRKLKSSGSFDKYKAKFITKTY